MSRCHRKRGFGFLIADIDRAEVFVHYTTLLGPPNDDGWRSLAPAQRVENDRVEGGGHSRAARIPKL